MKKGCIAIFVLGAVTMGMTACGGNKVSNHLGGATRGNGAYDYNYDYSAEQTDGTNLWNRMGFDTSRGAGYWDYYGITNGSANDSMRRDLTNTSVAQNLVTGNTTKTTGTVNPTLDGATVAN